MIGEMLCSYRNFPKIQMLRRLGQAYGKKCVCSNNPGQNIWHKVKSYNKIGQDFKNIIYNFAVFFDSYCQRLVSGRKTGN